MSAFSEPYVLIPTESVIVQVTSDASEILVLSAVNNDPGDKEGRGPSLKGYFVFDVDTLVVV